MKYVRQFWIILLISAMGEALHVLIPLPVPASVYGLVIMLIALGTHIIKLEQVKEAAEFLIEIMPVMFIPAGVGLGDVLVDDSAVPESYFIDGSKLERWEYFKGGKKEERTHASGFTYMYSEGGMALDRKSVV